MNGTWTDLQLAGKRVEIYTPPVKPRFGALFLHPLGLETLRGRPVYSALLDQHQLACICPHGQRSWWVDRVCTEFDPVLTPEKHLLENIVPLFRHQWNLMPRSIGIFGISMGGHGALRLAFKHPQRSPAPWIFMNYTAEARRSTICTTVRSIAGKTRRSCTCIRRIIRRTFSFASTPTTPCGFAATIACTRS